MIGLAQGPTDVSSAAGVGDLDDLLPDLVCLLLQSLTLVSLQDHARHLVSADPCEATAPA